jgi:hypothetical protein
VAFLAYFVSFLVYFVAFWHTFSVLVYCTKKKSGNPAPDPSPRSVCGVLVDEQLRRPQLVEGVGHVIVQKAVQDRNLIEIGN